jgi:hypothetical protein
MAEETEIALVGFDNDGRDEIWNYHDFQMRTTPGSCGARWYLAPLMRAQDTILRHNICLGVHQSSIFENRY